MRLLLSRVRLLGIILSIFASDAGAFAKDKTPAMRLAAIEAAQNAASEQYVKELQRVERTEAAQQLARDRFLAELNNNVEAALNLANDAPDDPAAFEALKFVIKTNRAGPGDATARALRVILDRGYAKAPRQGPYLGSVALPLFQYPDAERLLRQILASNPNRDNRGAACYFLAHCLLFRAEMVRKLRASPAQQKAYNRYKAAAPIGVIMAENDPDLLDQEAEALLERAVAEFGDVKIEGDPRELRKTAAGELFARRHLSIGTVAPEIEGFDHEGKPFKLSDYRGKVVVLTFSGNWCGPCVGMYPHERALQAKFKEKPFGLVSVNSDKRVDDLKKAIASGDITWRCWWDGGVDGPITTRWGIFSFPSVFVLDPQGVIRVKDVRGAELEQAVVKLLGQDARTAN